MRASGIAAQLLALTLAFLAPSVAALDVLPTEAHFGDLEARVIVRSHVGAVNVTTEPPVLAGGAAPGGEPLDMSATPRTLRANVVWHGLDSIVEVVLRRDDARAAIDVAIVDEATGGAWIEWPAAHHGVDATPALACALVVIAIAKVFVPARAMRRR